VCKHCVRNSISRVSHYYSFERSSLDGNTVDTSTTSEDFVKYSKRSMRILVEDALAEFPTTPVEVQTPCGTYNGLQPILPTEICAVSIMRSGDALLEAVREVEPACKVGKILIQRNESTKNKQAMLFYSKLPDDIANMHVMLLDPMLATGGSAMLALKVLCQDFGVDSAKVVFCNMICAPEGLKTLGRAYPNLKIVTAVIDEKLNEEKYIVPGLGDFGDRIYNTGGDLLQISHI